jgi:RimJ/RimL family protein N-acetyltransferase
MEKSIMGERICLKPLKKKDMKSMAKWHNDPEIMKYIAFTKILSIDYWLDWFEKMISNQNSLYFGITKNDDNQLIGYIHLEQILWDHKLCKDIGIVIGEKNEWDKGYGTEAMNLLIDFAFNKLDLHRLELLTLDFNKRGMNVWEKCGFKVEGIMKKARIVNGKWHDVIFMALLND